MTSSATDKKLEIDKNLENKLEIYKNLEIKLEIYSYFKLENKLEIFEFFVKGRWIQYRYALNDFRFGLRRLQVLFFWPLSTVLPSKSMSSITWSASRNTVG